MEAQDITYFATPAALQRWLRSNHAKATQLWLGYHKKTTAAPSVTWPESVDEALCVGWIDGIRKRIDDARYTIRFTPRKSGSIWSAVNVSRVAELERQGRMQAAGLAAFAARSQHKTGIYAYEQRSTELDEVYAKQFRRNKVAWAFYQAQAPSYRKVANWWVVSAKQEQTRAKRLAQLIEDSAAGRKIKQTEWTRKASGLCTRHSRATTITCWPKHNESIN